mmetsp:Transcript_36160/g.82855  ORF Transcript_36160/g.82855 Transcript_36160/m.82855 type:complete len:94 (-) Transcript_36160:43-324(-)
MTGVGYQGYRLVAGNRRTIDSEYVEQVKRRMGDESPRASSEQAWFAIVKSLGVTPITGSSTASHLEAALSGTTMKELNASDVIEIERWLDGFQ